MWGPGAPACIISFICHVPSGMMGINTLTAYLNAQELGDIYDFLPHGKEFMVGLAILGHAGTFTFAWNFLQFGGAPFCRGYLLTFVGVVDFALAVILTVGTAMAGMFLPGTLSGCNTASNWNNATDGRNFFVAANATGHFGDPMETTPTSICRSMMTAWIMTIVVITFYYICGIVTVKRALQSDFGTYKSFGDPPQYDIDSLPWLFAPVRVAVKLSVFVCRIVYASFYLPFRFISKYLARDRNPSLPKAPGKWKGAPQAGLADKPSLPPSSTRLPMELVLMITSDLHCVDLFNLTRSSRHLQSIFFSEQNPAKETIKDLTICNSSNSTRHCKVCNIPICSGCAFNAHVPPSTALRHRTGCRPSCTRCFFKTCITVPTPTSPGDHWNPNATRSNHYSSSRRARPSPISWTSPFSRRGCALRDVETHAEGESQRVYEEVCRNCASLPEGEMRCARDEHHVREMRRRRGERLACWRCRTVLEGDRVRWWVDPETGRECRWEGHPDWVEGK
ncbi:hypothetical protein C8A05DRAFT_17130 [Staphylotrichum tortipilum]|uniref:F-box domain-containing protein n=1 Tax=Staphylotrichum tortipilum TaxID=2831512 RepID=A0AAN6MH27_9PEZI|nr:hypothetical protein C8A05DRAFT_17130 [Staphylotrichum longicolle]